MTIKLIYHASGGDIDLDSAGVMQEDGWFTMVFIMLFSDRRATEGDEIPDRSGDRRGWPGDSFFPYPIGSRLWLLSREKIVPRLQFEAEDYAREALEPLLIENMASAVEVKGSTWQPPGLEGAREKWLRLDITITKADGELLPYGFSLRWEAQ
ncbi:phage GP46 family protein [Agarivorans sp. B2Z047]|uniref:phage GP46 family protein n=1 Tax=Agarivorans sp. B2Z047 TaxID=2652721 RepID=UPI002019A251|nr:phage GP46 family protein [Agarivorans sp. B2Z047]UQN43748.1 phage GP46 family protein [Agarivorans sp. B2Z047]